MRWRVAKLTPLHNNCTVYYNVYFTSCFSVDELFNVVNSFIDFLSVLTKPLDNSKNVFK